jgi:hypothetical protein
MGTPVTVDSTLGYAMAAVNNTDVSVLYSYVDADGSEHYPYMPYFGEMRNVPMWEMVVKLALYAIISLASLVGNILIIVIVLRDRRMRTTTNYYIVNLAVADLMVTLSCTWVHVVDDVTEGWVLGAFFCKANTFTNGKYTITYESN